MTSPVEHGIAERTLTGELRSGDRAVFVEFRGGALAAVIDGLGHGLEAATAAEAAVKILSSVPDAPLEDLVTRCHEALHHTRGAAMSLASLDFAHSTMTWLGIGNVDGLLARGVSSTGAGGDEGIIAAGGIVGYRLPTLRVRRLALHPGDTLVLASDGVKTGFRSEVVPVRGAQEVADSILARWAKDNDDVCVLVARYRGNLDDGSRVEIDGEADVAQARIRTRDRARALGFQPAEVEALATAVSELARNIIDHAVSGDITFVPVRDDRRKGLAVRARDRGPGIRDVARALQDDYSTADGLGCGLSGARRFVDDLHVETEVGAGTVVTITKWLR